MEGNIFIVYTLQPDFVPKYYIDYFWQIPRDVYVNTDSGIEDIVTHSSAFILFDILHQPFSYTF